MTWSPQITYPTYSTAVLLPFLTLLCHTYARHEGIPRDNSARAAAAQIQNAVLHRLTEANISWAPVGELTWMPDSAYVFRREQKLLPRQTYTVDLLLMGPCLAPFGAQKQILLEILLLELLRQATNTYLVKVEKVSQAEPLQNRTDAVLVGLSVALYAEGVYLSLEEAFASLDGGVFAPIGFSQSRFAQRALSYGLNITYARALAITKTGRQLGEQLKPTMLHEGTPSLQEADISGLLQQQMPDEDDDSPDITDRQYILATVFSGFAVVATILYTGVVRFPSLTAGLEICSPNQHKAQAVKQGSVQSIEKRKSSPSLSLYSERETLWAQGWLDRADLEILRHEDGTAVVLGEGAAGKVLKGLLDGIHEVAIKVFKDASDSSQFRTFLQEVELLKHCRNSQIVQFIGYVHNQREIWLVMEYMSGGNLYRSLRSSDTCQWYNRGAKIALDIARGMAFLHCHGILHSDLKSPNILLTRCGVCAKIADVGLARLLQENKTFASNHMQGTYDWMAPEVLIHGQAGLHSDVFSFGVILWEIVTQGKPVRGSMADVRVPQDCPLEAAQLIAECLSIDPMKRPSAKDIVKRLMAMAEDVNCSPRPSLAGSSRGSFASIPSHTEPNSLRDLLHTSNGLETLLSQEFAWKKARRPR
eukprot:jgi/Botrbrau1/10211/Bobra.0362s0001.1